jgi:hypothetical protein
MDTMAFTIGGMNIILQPFKKKVGFGIHEI